jgi:hypothetical protein
MHIVKISGIVSPREPRPSSSKPPKHSVEPASMTFKCGIGIPQPAKRSVNAGMSINLALPVLKNAIISLFVKGMTPNTALETYQQQSGYHHQNLQPDNSKFAIQPNPR